VRAVRLSGGGGDGPNSDSAAMKPPTESRLSAEPQPRSNDDGSPRADVPHRTPTPAARQAINENDERLVGKFKLGDEDAFIAIMNRYREMIFNVAMGVLHNRWDAEESTQDTFVRAHRALQQFRGESALSTWLYRIVLNVARNRYGYFRRRMQHVTSSLDSSAIPDRARQSKEILVSPEPDPEHGLELAEIAGQIERGMTQLRPKYREILLLRNTLHYSYPEIGAIIGINIGTVKSRIARARHSLRGQLTEL
jgi:RNA polymerase sigma-70 factor (ECF subfamily)